MTRWLQAARQAVTPRTKLTETTKHSPQTRESGQCTAETWVLSVSSVLSEGRRPATAPPAATRPCSGFDLSPDFDEADALDVYEERAAIREFDGGQPRHAAEGAALIEAALAAGVCSGDLRRRWADHPDACLLLGYLQRHGPTTVGMAGVALGWDLTRSWQAEARLRAAGRARIDENDKVHPLKTK